ELNAAHQQAIQALRTQLQEGLNLKEKDLSDLRTKVKELEAQQAQEAETIQNLLVTIPQRRTTPPSNASSTTTSSSPEVNPAQSTIAPSAKGSSSSSSTTSEPEDLLSLEDDVKSETSSYVSVQTDEDVIPQEQPAQKISQLQTDQAVIPQEQLAKRISQLQTEISDLQKKHTSELEQLKRTNQEEIQKLENSAKKAHENANQIQSEAKEARQTLIKKIEEKERELEHQTLELQERNVKQLEALSLEHEKSLTSLQNQLRDLSRTAQESNESFQQAQEQIQQASLQHSSTIHQLEQKSKSQIEALSKQLEDTKQKLAKAEQNITQERNTAETLRVNLTQVVSTAQATDILANETLASRIIDIERLEAMALARTAEFHKTSTAQQNEIQELKTALKSTKIEKADISSRIDSLSLERQQLQTKLATENAANTDLQNTTALLKRKNETLKEQFSLEKDSLSERLKDKEKEHQDLLRKFQALELQSKEQNTRLRDLQNPPLPKIQEKQAALTSTTPTAPSLQPRLFAVKTSLQENFQTRLNQLSMRQEDILSKINQLEAANTESQKAKTAIQQQLQTARETNGLAQNTIAQLQNQLSKQTLAAESASTQSTQQNQNLERQLNVLTNQNTALTTALQTATNQISEFTQKDTAKSSEIQIIQSQLATANITNTQFQTQLKTIQEQLAKQSAQEKTAIEENVLLRQKMVLFSTQFSQIKTETSTIQETNQRYKAIIETAKKRLPSGTTTTSAPQENSEELLTQGIEQLNTRIKTLETQNQELSQTNALKQQAEQELQNELEVSRGESLSLQEQMLQSKASLHITQATTAVSRIFQACQKLDSVDPKTIRIEADSLQMALTYFIININKVAVETDFTEFEMNFPKSLEHFSTNSFFPLKFKIFNPPTSSTTGQLQIHSQATTTYLPFDTGLATRFLIQTYKQQTPQGLNPNTILDEFYVIKKTASRQKTETQTSVREALSLLAQTCTDLSEKALIKKCNDLATALTILTEKGYLLCAPTTEIQLRLQGLHRNTLYKTIQETFNSKLRILSANPLNPTAWDSEDFFKELISLEQSLSSATQPSEILKILFGTADRSFAAQLQLIYQILGNKTAKELESNNLDNLRVQCRLLIPVLRKILIKFALHFQMEFKHLTEISSTGTSSGSSSSSSSPTKRTY
ncbi:MAG: hypothetical protein WCP39_01420, partial [Chlamydiota bacterium]